MDVRDCNGNSLADGDSVTVIKDLKVKGTSVTLKRGTVIRNIRLTDHEEAIECNSDKVIYYHMQQLEKHGLVFVERERLVSGIVEKHYRTVARDFLLDRAAFNARGKLDQSRIDALLGFVFDQSRVEIQRQIQAAAIDLERRAPDPGSLMAYRNVLKLSDEEAKRLYQRLLDFWSEYDAIAKQPSADGRFYAFVVSDRGVPQTGALTLWMLRRRVLNPPRNRSMSMKRACLELILAPPSSCCRAHPGTRTHGIRRHTLVTTALRCAIAQCLIVIKPEPGPDRTPAA